MSLWRIIAVWFLLSLGFLGGFIYADGITDKRAVAMAQEFLKQHAESIPICRPPPPPPSETEKWDPHRWKGNGKTDL